MEISSLNTGNVYKRPTVNKYADKNSVARGDYENLAPLKDDKVSFKGHNEVDGVGKYLEMSPDFTGWVTIPSKENDSKNYEANLEKLKTLQNKENKNAALKAVLSVSDFLGCQTIDSLEDADIHVFMENGKYKIAVSSKEDTITGADFAGHSYSAPAPKYYKAFVDFSKDNNYEIDQEIYFNDSLAEAKATAKQISKIKKELGEKAIKESNPEVILPYFKKQNTVKKDEDGKYIIGSYRQPCFQIKFEDLGIDENKLLENVKEIHGTADFRNSSATNIANLEKVGNDLYLSNSNISELSKLKQVGGHAYLTGSQLKDFGVLEEVGATLEWKDAPTTSAGKLRKVGGNTIVPTELKQAVENQIEKRPAVNNFLNKIAGLFLSF